MTDCTTETRSCLLTYGSENPLLQGGSGRNLNASCASSTGGLALLLLAASNCTRMVIRIEGV